MGSLRENPKGLGIGSSAPGGSACAREVLRLETEAPTRIRGSGPRSQGLGQALVPKAQVERSWIGGIS